MNIDEPTPEISAWKSRWQTVRDVVAGEYQIKLGRETYLPRGRTGQGDIEYEKYLGDTPFYPATARTAQGKKGLMFAANVVLQASDEFEQIKETITANGMSIRELAEEVVWETLQTNFTGLLVEHGSKPEGVELNGENAIEEGYRPFIHLYPAETILEATYGVVRNRKQLVRVRVMESKDRVLELLNRNGIYIQRIHNRSNGKWTFEEVIPDKDGVPFREIPFVIISDNNKACPQPSVLEDIVRLNLNHYRKQGKISAIHMFVSGVIPYIAGIVPENGEDGKPKQPQISFNNQGYIVVPDANTKFGFWEPDGKQIESLERERQHYEEQMAKVGARMLAPERVAPEAEATVALRSAAEDSTNASLALRYASRFSKALTFASRWLDGTEATYTLNTDYQNRTMNAQEMTAALAMVQAGQISWRTFFFMLRDRKVVNATLTPEEERTNIEQDNIDRPTAEL